MSFESIHGLYHYLICPEDDVFFTNSLERLSYHEYLYRRLREQGYRRIVFFDYQKESHQYKILTFDKLSQVSFERGKLFFGADIENERALSQIYKQAEEAPALNTVKLKGDTKSTRFTEKDLGMATLGSKISGAKLHRYLMNNVCDALLQSEIPSAIVLPVAILDTIEGEQMGCLLETFNKLYSAQNFNHIILFTLTERGDMLKFRRYTDMLRGFKCFCGAEDAWLQNSIASLKASDNLVEVSQIEADEIENLLLREKLKGNLGDLEYSKIGGIAGLILKQCKSKKHRVFKHLKSVSDPENTRQYFPMRMIEHCLSDPLFISELCDMARNLKCGEIAEEVRMPLNLSRFDGGVGGRYKAGERAEEIIAELDNFVGMEYLKQQVLIFINKFKKERKKYEDAIKTGGKIPEFPYMNMRFVGPPGTGKTTVANIVGRLLCAEGILYRSEPTCFKAGDIHSNGYCDVIGAELEKRIDAGIHGVVVIDEFYNFNRAYNGGNQANEAFSAIMSRVDDHKEDLCLILAGYEDEMESMFRDFNPGGVRRFPYVFTFKPYTTDQLFEIAENVAVRDGMVFDDEAKDAVKRVIDRAKITQGKGFGNAGFISDELLPKIDAAHLSRGGGDIYTAEDVAAAFSDFNGILNGERENESEILKELDALIGMDGVKRQIKLFVKKLEKERKKYDMAVKNGGKVPKMPYMNIRFEGPPGTGKTTVANILARLLCAKGILYRGEPTCFNAGDVQSGGIADVVGREVSKRLESGVGGVVVIDEFYNFDRAYSGGNIANEALSAIMNSADNNKENLCLIVAGYEDEMDGMFKRFNPGAARRFPYVFTFKPYSADALMAIAERMAESDGMRFEDSAKPLVKRIIEREKARLGRSFGNAGFIEDYLIPKIDAEYLLRDGEDGVYTTNDVFAAFPQV